MSEQRDLNVCPQTEDGRHRPFAAAVNEPTTRSTHFTVECRACWQTTGVPIPAEIEWN